MIFNNKFYVVELKMKNTAAHFETCVACKKEKHAVLLAKIEFENDLGEDVDFENIEVVKIREIK